MGYLSDITTLLNAGFINKDRTPNNSIAKGSMDGTLQFPCLISDSIPAGMASVIVNTLEPVYASFVQTVLSMNSTVDISVDKVPKDFLRRFHKNISTFESVDQFDITDDEFMEKVADGNHKVFVNESQNTMVLFNVSKNANRVLLENHKDMLDTMLNYVDVTPIINVGNSPYYEADRDIPTKSELFDTYMRNRERREIPTDPKNLPGVRVLKDMEVKKINEMQPHVMQVRLMAVNGEKEFVQFMDFMVGVKVVLHTIRSEELIYNAKSAVENTGKFFNFLKWTTGEKSLFKDLILNLNNVKLDVANKSKGASPWWLTLKRLKATTKLQEVLYRRNQIVPNATLVVSAFEVDNMHKQFGYNLYDPTIAKKLMDSLFLMNFIVIDEGSQFVKILYDGQKDYQLYSLDALEREVQTSSSRLSKELVRMVSR